MQLMAVKVDIELRAAAAAASVLGAKLVRRDIPGAPSGTRDFDLVLTDESIEPLEVTRHADELAWRSWERIKSGLLPAPSLRRVWILGVAASSLDPTGVRQPFDQRRFRREIEGVLAALEQAGNDFINYGRLERTLPAACETLLELGVQDGFSRAPRAGEAPHVNFNAPVGGITLADLVAVGVEAEAQKADNQRKLTEPAQAARRHLFVVFDGSSGSAFNAVDRGLLGRIPVLPKPITTAWAATGGHVLVTSPPGPWVKHDLPRAVFDSPEDFLL
jgi:hypothetical protein